VDGAVARYLERKELTSVVSVSGDQPEDNLVDESDGPALLSAAIKDRDARFLHWLLSQKALDVNQVVVKRGDANGDDFMSAPKLACVRDHPDMLAILIEEGGLDVNFVVRKTEDGEVDTLLSIAVMAHSLECFKLLLRHGADASIPRPMSGVGSLFQLVCAYAAASGNLSFIEALLEKSVSPPCNMDHPPGTLNACISILLASEKIDPARLVPIFNADGDLVHRVLRMYTKIKPDKGLKRLIASGAVDLDAPSGLDGYTPLHVCVTLGLLKFLKLLLRCGANPDAKCPGRINFAFEFRGSTPLMLLCSSTVAWLETFWKISPTEVISRRHKMVRALLASKALVDRASKALVDRASNSLITPLQAAVSNNTDDVDLIHILLEAGATFIPDQFQPKKPIQSVPRSPLHFAARWGNLDAIDALCHTKGVQVNGLDEHGMAPYHYAAATNTSRLMNDLQYYGADPEVLCSRGMTPLQYAVIFGSANAVEYLGPRVDVNAHAPGTESPLLLAIVRGLSEIVRILVRCGRERGPGASGRRLQRILRRHWQPESRNRPRTVSRAHFRATPAQPQEQDGPDPHGVRGHA
jgi:ankyrin repeat protein